MSSSSLRDALQLVLDEYKDALEGAGHAHRVSKTVRTEIPQHLSEFVSGLLVKPMGSSGSLQKLPWIAIQDSELAPDPQQGIYIAYLADVPNEKWYLALAQGTGTIEDRYRSVDTKKRIVTARAELFRQLVRDADLELGAITFSDEATTPSNRLWGPGTICYREYHRETIPDEAELRADLQALIELYQTRYSKMTVSEVQARVHTPGDTQKVPTGTPDVFQVPLPPSGETPYRNLSRTVEQPVDSELLASIDGVPSLDSDEMYLWGSKEGPVSDDNSWVMFATYDEENNHTFTIQAPLRHSFTVDDPDAKEIAEAVGWESYQDDYYRHIMILGEPVSMTLPVTRYPELKGDAGLPNEFSRIDFDNATSEFHDQYRSLPDFLLQTRDDAVGKWEQLLNEAPAVWRIAPGIGGKYWDAWAANNIVSLGSNLNSSIDDDKYETQEELVDIARNMAKNTRSHQAYRFQNEIECGDIIVAGRQANNKDYSWFYAIGVAKTAHYETDAYHGEYGGEDFKDEDVIDVEWAIVSGETKIGAGTGLSFPRYALSKLDESTYQNVVEILDDEEYLEGEKDLLIDLVDGSDRVTLPDDAPTPSGPDTDPTVPEQYFARASAALEEEIRPELYRRTIAHLVAGRSVVFYGPPGTGKTRAARRIAKWLTTDGSQDAPEPSILTAHAELTNHDLVGGYRPAGDGTWTPEPGSLTSVVQACHKQLEQTGRPRWLIIDEINRANLDEAFGDVFTLLDLDYRESRPLPYAGDESIYMPLSFRLLATMNTHDRAQLFSLGYAFRRRFAFVETDSLLNIGDASSDGGRAADDLPDPTDPARLPRQKRYNQLRDIISKEVRDNLSRQSTNNDPLPAHDAGVLDPTLADPERIDNILENLLSRQALSVDGRDPIDIVLDLSYTAADEDVVEIGQAIPIDILRYLVAYALVFGSDAVDLSVLDRGVAAYFVPQFDIFASELREAVTLNEQSDAETRLNDVIGAARSLDLDQTARRLNRLRSERRII